MVGISPSAKMWSWRAMPALALVFCFWWQAGAPAEKWQLLAGPYTTTHLGYRCLIVQLHWPGHWQAVAERFSATQRPAFYCNGPQWHKITDIPGATGHWRNYGGGIEAVLTAGQYLYHANIRQVRVPAEQAVGEVWKAVQQIFVRHEQRQRVAEVHARPLSALRGELWVPEFAEIMAERPAAPWVRPDGIVRGIVLGAASPGQPPAAPSQRIAGGTATVGFTAEFRLTRRRTVQVRWYMGDRLLRASQTTVAPGGQLMGWLTAPHGLPAGRYRLEIHSSAGLEAKVEFLVLPKMDR